MNEPEDLKNKRWAARFFGVSVPTVERWMRDGLPHVRLSAGVVRFRLVDLVSFVEERRVRRAGDEA